MAKERHACPFSPDAHAHAPDRSPRPRPPGRLSRSSLHSRSPLSDIRGMSDGAPAPRHRVPADKQTADWAMPSATIRPCTGGLMLWPRKNDPSRHPRYTSGRIRSRTLGAFHTSSGVPPRPAVYGDWHPVCNTHKIIPAPSMTAEQHATSGPPEPFRVLPSSRPPAAQQTAMGFDVGPPLSGFLRPPP